MYPWRRDLYSQGLFKLHCKTAPVDRPHSMTVVMTSQSSGHSYPFCSQKLRELLKLIAPRPLVQQDKFD